MDTGAYPVPHPIALSQWAHLGYLAHMRTARTSPRRHAGTTGAATISDVAARAGVSTSTVSRFLTGQLRPSPDTAAAVERAVAELHYRPHRVARSLRMRQTAAIGMVTDNLVDPVLPALVKAIAEEAEQAGYTIVMGTASSPAQSASEVDSMLARGVDGLIIGCSWPPEYLAGHLAHARVPVVFANTEGPGVGMPQYGSDNEAGAHLGARHLLDLGHTSIAYVAGPATSPFNTPRLAGVRRAWREAGLPEERVLVLDGGGTAEGGLAAAERALAMEGLVTAVACYNDLTAIGVLRGLEMAGRRVPEDWSVLGFDDIAEAAWTDPALTTIHQDSATMGRLAVTRLVAALRGEATADADAAEPPVHLPMELVVRRSTGAPAGSAAARRAPGA